MNVVREVTRQASLLSQEDYFAFLEVLALSDYRCINQRSLRKSDNLIAGIQIMGDKISQIYTASEFTVLLAEPLNDEELAAMAPLMGELKGWFQYQQHSDKLQWYFA